VNTEIKNGLILGLGATLALLCIGLTYTLTIERVEKTAKQQLQITLNELLIPGSYDNVPADDVVFVTHPDLGSNEPRSLFLARKNGQPSAVIIPAIAIDGYNGNIEYMIGLRYSGEITGVRVVSHKETPGLGDDIEIARSNWILSFDTLSLAQLAEDQWQVKKEGGEFDQFTGATITPRALVHSVHRVLKWYNVSRDEIFNSNN